jgi:LysR family transcriptional regulator, glycine cleavage system transcriptional activator
MIGCARRPDAWRLWAEGVGAADRRQDRLAVDTNLLATTLAEAGAGIAIAPYAFVAAELARGTLLEEGAVCAADGRGYHLVAAGSARRPAVTRFLDWAAARASR